MSRRSNQFSSVRTEGGLLPQDLLSRIQSGDKTLAGLTSESYHLGPHERVGEAVNRAWSRLMATWRAFEEALAKESNASLATGLTRDRWLLPLFQELGYGRLPKGHAIEVEGKSFAVSHTWHQSPIHLLGAGVDLDRRQAGVAGAAKASPHGLVQEFLNRSDDHLWGFVSNGLQLRVLRDHHSLTRQAYVEFDMQAIMLGEQYSEFLLLWTVCHQSRVEAEKPEDCWLETWFNTSRDEGVRALDKLRGGVENAIEAFGTGLLSDKSNVELREALESGELDKQEYYRQVLRLVYRLIFLFVAEERDALLDPDADEEARNRYLKYYATRRLRTLADKRRGGPHGDVWQGLRLVMSKLDDGCPELALPALGSRLWNARACPALMDAECGNDHVLEAIRYLSNIQEGRAYYPVNWRNVGADELGSIYEGLLELHPRINKEAGTFVLDTAAGHERKTTGSYYTPTELVDCLLDSALDPVLDEAAKKANPEEAILDLKVCDPACGSGHFLVAAARRIAKRLAAVRAGEDEPSPKDVQHALRDVVGRCLYGVDVNPMAVELCKVSLWMEAIEPGRPLSFLDSHIQCGNALLGATPALMARGIPDDAFKPIEGDDKKVAGNLKKQNKKERKSIEAGQETMFAAFDSAATKDMAALAERTKEVEQTTDDDIFALRAKEERWENLTRSAEFTDAWFRANVWCAAFVWPKRPGDYASAAITEERWRFISRDTSTAPPLTRRTVRELARRYRFFHWHLAFPTVFGRIKKSISADDTTGWTDGFDLLLGNPPWDKIQPEEQKFFANRRPEIATARTGAQRKHLIAALEHEDPPTMREWLDHKRGVEAVSQLVKSSGLLSLTSRGNLNLYRLFAEHASQTLGADGRAGMIVQTGLATDQTSKDFLVSMVTAGRLARFLDFENRGRFFTDVHAQFRFALITLRGTSAKPGEKTTFGWLLGGLDELETPGRLVVLGPEDLHLFNPSSQTAPTFTSERDLEINRQIYSSARIIFVTEDDRYGTVDFQGELYNMTRDSKYFSGSKSEEVEAPLYEAKFIHLFDHRFATSNGGSVRDVEAEEKSDPSFAITPRYWLNKADVSARVAKQGHRYGWMAGFRDVSSGTNERTAIFSVLPHAGVGNSINLLLGLDARQSARLIANANSFVFDYACRQKMSGMHVNIWIAKQLPAVPPETYGQEVPWASGLTGDWVQRRVLELVYTAWDLEAFARDCGYGGPPFQWSEARRFLLRCELDAAFFHLYGVQRDDADYIMETFPIVARKDVQEHGDYRTKLQILDIYDRMQRAIDTGEPYQTVLDPPPADPRVAHPERIRPERAPGREPLPEMPGTIPTLDPQHDVPLVIWALLRARGDRIGKMDLARAFALRSQPAILAQLAPPVFAEAASAWSDRVGQRDVTPGALAQGLSDLATRNGVQLTTDGKSRSVVAASEQTPTDDKIDPWFRFEARLALAVLDALPPAQLSDIDGALSGEDRELLEAGSA